MATKALMELASQVHFKLPERKLRRGYKLYNPDCECCRLRAEQARVRAKRFMDKLHANNPEKYKRKIQKANSYKNNYVES